jgi:transmembrane sensor
MSRILSIGSRRRSLGRSPQEAAAYWAVRHDRGDLTAEEQAGFARWRADPASAEAFAKANDVFRVFDASHAADSRLSAIRQEALQASPKRHYRLVAVAASLAAVGLAGLLALKIHGSFQSRGAPVTAQTPAAAAPLEAVAYTTGIGERRTVRLPDGSAVTLDTASRIETRFSTERRSIHLVRGQVLFDVAHDPTRPFAVDAGDWRVTAVGTVFEVRLDASLMRVVLAQGHVLVENPDRLPSDPSSIARKPVQLRPGQEFTARLDTAPRIVRVDVDRALSWVEGYVEFDDEPLETAVAEINRYTDRPIVLGGDGVGALRVSGVFRTGDPRHFVDVVSEVLPIDVQPTQPGGLKLSLTRRRPRAAH